MEIPGQGKLFDSEAENSENDSNKDKQENLPTIEESIAKAKYFLTPEGRQEIRTERWLEAERKHQREEAEAEAMAEAKQLEAEGRYTFNKSEWDKVENESLRRYVSHEVKKFREEHAQKDDEENKKD